MRELSKRLMLVPFLLLIGYYFFRIYRQFWRFVNGPETLVVRYETSGSDRTSDQLAIFPDNILGLNLQDSSLIEHIRAFWIKKPPKMKH